MRPEPRCTQRLTVTTPGRMSRWMPTKPPGATPRDCSTANGNTCSARSSRRRRHMSRANWACRFPHNCIRSEHAQLCLADSFVRAAAAGPGADHRIGVHEFRPPAGAARGSGHGDRHARPNRAVRNHSKHASARKPGAADTISSMSARCSSIPDSHVADCRWL